MTNKVQELTQRAETLKGERSNFETEWQNVADIFRPVKADITVSRTKGQKEQIRRLFESFPITAVSTLKSIVIGVFFNRSIKPISITSPDEEINEDPDVAEWLTDYTEMMLKNMFDPKSKFERALSEAVADDIVFGTMVTFIEKGRKFPLNYKTLNIKNVLIAESEDGDPDYLVRDIKMQARKIGQKWSAKVEAGKAKLHRDILKAIEEKPFQEFELQLHIMPRDERNKDKIDRINKPIAGFWVDKKNKIIIEETGWDTMPAAVGRSEKGTEEDYGTSRGMIALADARQLNDMSRQINELTELAGKPPLIVNADFNRRINQTPGALNFPDEKFQRSGNPAVEQMITTGNIPLTDNLIIRKEERIREAFFLDKLKIFDNPNATATQVLELRAESFRIMGDFISGLVEYMDAVLNRTFDLLFRQIYLINAEGNPELIPDNGLFNKEFPEALLANTDLKVNYINPITQSQRLNEDAALDKWLGAVANIAQFNPEALDLINVDEVVRTKRDILNVDPELILSKDRVNKIRQQRAAQQAQQEQAVQTQEAVETAATAKKAGLT